ncbi:hypothetical protein S83_042585, partial [Arachis hypogaea]
FLSLQKWRCPNSIDMVRSSAEPQQGIVFAAEVVPTFGAGEGSREADLTTTRSETEIAETAKAKAKKAAQEAADEIQRLSDLEMALRLEALKVVHRAEEVEKKMKAAEDVVDVLRKRNKEIVRNLKEAISASKGSLKLQISLLFLTLYASNAFWVPILGAGSVRYLQNANCYCESDSGWSSRVVFWNYQTPSHRKVASRFRDSSSSCSVAGDWVSLPCGPCSELGPYLVHDFPRGNVRFISVIGSQLVISVELSEILRPKRRIGLNSRWAVEPLGLSGESTTANFFNWLAAFSLVDAYCLLK